MEHKQIVLSGDDVKNKLDTVLSESGLKNVLLVCGHSISHLKWDGYFSSLKDRLGIRVHRFYDFEVNPSYEAVIRGVNELKSTGSGGIIAAGGGSAIDTAKCIKLFSDMDITENCLDQKIIPNNIPLYVIPTTAGSGSEATQFAVIYKEGKKRSVSDPSLIPSTVVHDPSVLKSLPHKQKAATLMDAVCHSIESMWSLLSTEENSGYAADALTLLWKNADRYLESDENTFEEVQYAAYMAGKAINISRTTAGHAMCYKITTTYGIPHGAAAALCVSELWKRMLEPSMECTDPKGISHISEILHRIASCMGKEEPTDAQKEFEKKVRECVIDIPHGLSDIEIDRLTRSVNAERMKNYPFRLTKEQIQDIYRSIFI